MKHLKDARLTYLQHFKRATSIGLRLMFAGFCCLFHAVFPCMFCQIGSDTIKQLKQEIDEFEEKDV